MTTAQCEARTFLAQFHHRPFSISDLKKALQAQGFSLVEYSRTSNCKEVTTLLTALRLFDYAASQSAFTYQDANLRIVFLLENLSQQEQMVLLSHELGHILCHHLDHAPITGPGTACCRSRRPTNFQPTSCDTISAASLGASLWGWAQLWRRWLWCAPCCLPRRPTPAERCI